MGKKGNALGRLVGRWTGTATTWFEPGSEPLVEKIHGRITMLKDARTLSHTYRTRVQGQVAHGTALIGTDNASLRPCIAWVDSCHTTGDVMLFQGDGRKVEGGFSARGQYAAPSGPPWGWRTTYALRRGRLEIVHFNITPDGQEAVAIRVDYRREA